MFKKKTKGFTLIEILITVAIISILTAIAVPSYGSYLNKTRGQAAGTDLASLALNIENQYQLTLAYPVISSGTTATNTLFPGWSASQSSYFNYTVNSTATTYTLTATGKSSSAGCNLTLDNTNARTVSSSCNFTSW
jgi:type IV pilus assembly protein PilE